MKSVCRFSTHSVCRFSVWVGGVVGACVGCTRGGASNFVLVLFAAAVPHGWLCRVVAKKINEVLKGP